MTNLDKYKGLNEWSDEIIKELEELRVAHDYQVKLNKLNKELQNICKQALPEYEKLDKALIAIDDHIRQMRVDKIISMDEMIAALKVISDVLYSGPSKAGSGE